MIDQRRMTVRLEASEARLTLRILRCSCFMYLRDIVKMICTLR